MRTPVALAGGHFPSPWPDFPANECGVRNAECGMRNIEDGIAGGMPTTVCLQVTLEVSISYPGFVNVRVTYLCGKEPLPLVKHDSSPTWLLGTRRWPVSPPWLSHSAFRIPQSAIPTCFPAGVSVSLGERPNRGPTWLPFGLAGSSCHEEPGRAGFFVPPPALVPLGSLHQYRNG